MVRSSRSGTCVFYPIQVGLRYEVENELRGQGRTVGLSREIVRFECDDLLPLGLPIRLILMWPALLPDGTPLNLWIGGRITRNSPHLVDVRVISYEFRTRPGVKHRATPISREVGESDAKPMVASLGLMS